MPILRVAQSSILLKGGDDMEKGRKTVYGGLAEFVAKREGIDYRAHRQAHRATWTPKLGGWDVRCKCGWESRTGGAIRQRVKEYHDEHVYEALDQALADRSDDVKKGRSDGGMVQCQTCKLVRPDRRWYTSCPRCGDNRTEFAEHHQVWFSPTSRKEWDESQRVNDEDWTKFKERGMKSLFVVEDPIVDVTARSLFELVVDEPRMMKDGFEKSHDPLGMAEDHISARDVFAGEGSGMKAWVHPSGEMHELPWTGEHSRESARIGMSPTEAVHANYARVGFDGPERGHQGVAYGEFHHYAPKAVHSTVLDLGARAEREGHSFYWECHDGEPSPQCAGASTNGKGAQSLREHFGLKKSQPGMMKLRPGEKGWMTIRGDGPMSGRPIRAEMGRGLRLRPPTERHNVNLGPEIGMREYAAEESKRIRALPHEKAHADDLLKQYRQSTPEQRKRGHNWYPRASQIVDRYAGQHQMPTGKKVGYSRSQISGALAALSPRQNWGENVFMLDRVVRAHQHGTEFKRVRGLGFRGNGQKAWRILGGADPAEVLGERKRTGQKVRAFHHALENFDGKEHADHSKCDQPTVVDQLMDRAMHGSQKPNHRPTNIDGKVYREHSNAVRVAAMRAGVEPWALQATVWTKMNDEGGAAARTHVGAEGQPHMLKLAGVWPGSTKRRKLVLKSHSVWRMTSS